MKNYKAWAAGAVLMIVGFATGNMFLVSQGVGFLAAPEVPRGQTYER